MSGHPELDATAARLRLDTMRMIAAAGAGHPGSSLSAIEILTVLHYHTMRHRPADPTWAERDRFVLSKGHAAPALYAVLIDLGVLPRELAGSLRALGSPLQGHPDPRTRGIEVGSGSLGQAFSVAVGMALGLGRRGLGARVFALLGDGECQEGQVWEAAMCAAQLGLADLTVIVDANGIQHDGRTADIMGAAPLAAKWRAFGWEVVEADGHDCAELIAALAPSPGPHPRPRAVIAHTVKGRGVSFMEDDPNWHSVADPGRLAEAVEELSHA
ncbi:transketolase [Embleya sp. NPDC020886]|uniref:transketolase n=1 Tax=Embleya sp. NPDC020886 TaxID=3363980 RepID=UPI0037A14DD2